MDDFKFQKIDTIDLFQPKKTCLCSMINNKFALPDEIYAYEVKNNNQKLQCSIYDFRESSVDISMLEIFQSIQILYPSYVWTHNGWVQEMDSKYDVSQWNTQYLIVHIVPFSHNDPGWIRTEDEYYRSFTKYTLDIVLDKLTENKDMTFIWAEVIFLQKWFDELSTDNKEKFKKILLEERFEILTGGWVMTDEAIVHYEAMLDQLIEGHLWLKNALNYSVETAWAVDPFGHSSTMPYLLQQANIKNMYIQRTHYAVKKHLAFNKQIEFLWKQAYDSNNTYENEGIFTHMSPYMLYSTQYSCGPDINVCCEFDFTRKKCWKWAGYREPEAITAKNVKFKSELLLEQLRKKSQFFNHNHVLLMVGDDFRYTSYQEWNDQWSSFSKLIDYMNSHSNMKVQMKFSTIGNYLKSAKEFSTSIPSLKGDFFPYSDRSNQYWSGFFSSRPLIKLLARKIQSDLRIAEILHTILIMKNESGINHYIASILENLIEARRKAALIQHHDTITGTSRQDVIQKTLEYMTIVLNNLGKSISKMTSLLLYKTPKLLPQLEMAIQQSNINIPEILALSHFPRMVVLLNPLTKSQMYLHHIYTKTVDIQVYDSKNKPVPCQINPISDYETYFRKDKYEVVFNVYLDPLSISSFYIRKSESNTSKCILSKVEFIGYNHDLELRSPFEVKWSFKKNFQIENTNIAATFCQCTGLLMSIITKHDMVPFKTQMKFVAYGTGSWLNPYSDKSGSYIFLPDGPSKELDLSISKTIITDGPLQSSVTTWISPKISQTIVIIKTKGLESNGVLIENYVNLSSSTNREIAFKFDTTIQNFNEFMVDSNSFTMQKRISQSRLPLQANFFPMTSSLFIEDENFRISLASRQSHGVASLEEGSLEVILDRRLAQDDWRGLNEGVEDNIPLKSHFILTVESFKNPKTRQPNQTVGYHSALMSQLIDTINNPLVSMIGNLNNSLINNDQFQVNLIGSKLPCNVHLVNLRYITEDIRKFSFLIILRKFKKDCNIINIDFKSQLCEDTFEDKIDLNTLFNGIKLLTVYETNISGIRIKKAIFDGVLSISLMQIKTWLITVNLN